LPVPSRTPSGFDVTSILSNAAALWNLILLLAVIGTLVWFLYGFVFRRLVRARRIAGARDRRMLREAAERESGDIQ
jgi:phosphotransferase system  glucose/maltose/N-acetylglucosamine-specific IIC component